MLNWGPLTRFMKTLLAQRQQISPKLRSTRAWCEAFCCYAPAIAASVAMTFALTRLRLLHQDSVASVPDQAAQPVINTVENDVTTEHVNEAEPGSEGSSLDQTLDSTKSLPEDCPK